MITIREIKSLEDLKSFYAESANSLHIVKMGAQWCYPCVSLSNVLRNLDQDKIGNTLIAEVNVDDESNKEILIEYNVKSIPLTLYVKNGTVIDKFLGSTSENELYNRIEEYK
jgi:thioredoxin 1